MWPWVHYMCPRIYGKVLKKYSPSLNGQIIWGLSSILPLTQALSKGINIFYRGTKINPVSTFPEDRK